MDVIVLDELSSKIDDLGNSITEIIVPMNGSTESVVIDVSDIKTQVAQNSTASSNGTLSQKLAYLIGQIGSTSDSAVSLSSGTMMGKLNLCLAKAFNAYSYSYLSYGTSITNGKSVSNATVGSISNKNVTKVTLSATRKGSSTYPDSNYGTLTATLSGGLTNTGTLDWESSGTEAKSVVLYDAGGSVPKPLSFTAKISGSTSGYVSTTISSIKLTVEHMP